MKVLIACEFSGIVRDAFAARDHDAWSCDLLPTERPGNHIQGDVLEILDAGWDLMIAHPPCTYLTNAGVRHLHSVPFRNGNLPKIHGLRRWEEMKKAANFFNQLKEFNINCVVVENPIPHKYAVEIIGKYNQLIQPYEFGTPERKAICLWLKNVPPLISTLIETIRSPKVHLMSPSKDRAKERSRFFPSIAQAMASQWS